MPRADQDQTWQERYLLQLPIGKEDDFKGIIDLFEMQAYIYNDDKGDDISVTDIPEDMKDDAELYHTELVEKICELDDDLMMEYLEGEEPSVEAMKAVLEKLPANVLLFRYAVVLHTETKVYRSSWMQSLSSCLHRQIFRRSRV